MLKILLLGSVLHLSLSAEARSLILGDSHSFGAFGKHLSKELDEAGNDPWLYAVEGGDLNAWMTTGKGRSRANIKEFRDSSWSSRYGSVSTVPELVAQSEASGHAVDEVIFQAGTNMYYALKSQRSIDSLRSVLGRTSSFLKERGLNCFWVTPPRSRVNWIPQSREEDFVKIIQEELPDCKIFVTLPILDPSKLDGDDGIHYNPPESKQWAVEFLKVYKSAAKEKSKAKKIAEAKKTESVEVAKAARICDVELKLEARPKISTDLSGIVYTHALADFVYKVVKDNGDKACPKKGDSIVVVHQIVKNKKFTSVMDIEADRVYSLSLVEFEGNFPELQGLQRISDHELFSAVPYASYFEFND